MTKEERAAEYRKKHFGESNTANCGMKMFIIAYRNNDNIDVVFQDGTVVKNKRYKNFTKGKIANPNIGLGLKVYDRIGDMYNAINGQAMIVVAYRKRHDIDIQFEDGTVVSNKSYSSFERGRVRNPNNINIPSKHLKRVGETKKAGNGQMMTIIAYRHCNDIDIQFEDGTIIEHRWYCDFTKGYIGNPNYRGGTNKKIRIGEQNIASNGQKMTIIDYKNRENLDVEFEDGTIVKNVRYNSFLIGCIENPNKRISTNVSLNEFAILYYLRDYGFIRGKARTLKSFGLGRKEIDIFHPILKIGIEYDGYGHTDVCDLDKNKLCNNAGIHLIRIRENYNTVLKDGLSTNFYLTDRTRLSQDFQDCLINVVKYINQISGLNIDNSKINFTRDKNSIYSEFLSQQIPSKRRLPPISTVIKRKANRCSSTSAKLDRIGEVNMSVRGEQMTIVGYRSNKDIDIQFEDGTIVKNNQYMNFKKGTIANPSHSIKTSKDA